ncbi:hypothetical protein KC19_VG158200 [Ceratodon purpureus]|uniref:Uncharacterized protein n=1 Tax=Ceratodon purpureus TaxID=3225 RepID=A0A8T0HQG5_CERPU|nr:hypothetical protein KC19_VG158200 [Ceratodon purpureus]
MHHQRSLQVAPTHSNGEHGGIYHALKHKNQQETMAQDLYHVDIVVYISNSKSRWHRLCTMRIQLNISQTKKITLLVLAAARATPVVAKSTSAAANSTPAVTKLDSAEVTTAKSKSTVPRTGVGVPK